MMELFRVTAIGEWNKKLRQFYVVANSKDEASGRVTGMLRDGFHVKKTIHLGQGMDFGDKLFRGGKHKEAE